MVRGRGEVTIKVTGKGKQKMKSRKNGNQFEYFIYRKSNKKINNQKRARGRFNQ